MFHLVCIVMSIVVGFSVSGEISLECGLEASSCVVSDTLEWDIVRLRQHFSKGHALALATYSI